MENNFVNLDSLKEQLFLYKPTLKSSYKKDIVYNKLRYQLTESKAVVRLQRMDAECERLMSSLKQRLMLLQDVLIPKHQQQKCGKEKQILELNLSDSSDDEMLSTWAAKKEVSETMSINVHENSIEKLHADSSEAVADKSSLPLALRKMPRERKLSYKSYSSSSTSNSRNYKTNSYAKQEQTVSTSAEVCHHNENILLDEFNSTPTLHIKIPSLHRDNVHYIVLDSLKFARKAFDFRAREVKQQHQQQSVILETKIKKSHKKQLKTLESGSLFKQLAQQEQDAELSQLIQDVMAEACNDETLQATNALENINNNLLDNYDPHTNDSFLSFSQSSQEISLSQITNKSDSCAKKSRKNVKRSNEKKSDEPPKKRGRKPKKKDSTGAIVNQPQSQPPTKSNLAKYVEYFANDCNQFIPGSSTPAASSTMSQPLVSSTTHNFELVGQQQNQPITYFIDGDWANGGPCQLVPTSGSSVDFRQMNSDDLNVPFQEIVNYIDNNSDMGSNVLARVLENGSSLPISIPLPIANMGLQNLIQNQMPKTSMQSTQISSIPIINIQIPNLPNNIKSSPPPQAHSHEEVLDLTVKTKSKINLISNEVINFNNKLNDNTVPFTCNNEENCLPLDLSIKKSENICITIDDQDDDFIRHLIETSDFDYTSQELKKSDNPTILPYDDRKSFKSALDMPLLDFDDTDLSQLEKDSTTSNKNNNNERDSIVDDDCLHNEGSYMDDSNYISMVEENSSIENHLHFSDSSTKEIFDKLLDIVPNEQIRDDIRNENISVRNDLNENDFCHMQSSIMCVTEPLSPERATNEISSNELTISSLPEDVTTEVKEMNSKKCNDNNTHRNENEVCDKSEDLNSSLSSEITLNLNLSDNEDNILNSANTNKSNLNNEIKTVLSKDTKNETGMECEKTTTAINCSKSNPSSNHIKTNEKIVFSVSKIALSDDDNLYTDSDTVSGKSCDITDENKINTTNNITNKLDPNFTMSKDNDAEITSNENDATNNPVTNVTVNSEELNNSNKEGLIEKITNIKNSSADLIKHKCSNDVTEDNVTQQFNNGEDDVYNETIKLKNISSDPDHVNINEIKVIHSKDDVVINKNNEQGTDSSNKEANDDIKKYTTYNELGSIKGLTLLDLESKIEDPLDFDEDFDDALSLETSCFDSPNDDRFLDSITEETNLDKPEEDSSSSMDLNKPFKIPKIKNSNSNTLSNLIDVEPNEPALCITPVEEKTFVNLEKIKITVTNDAAAQSSLYTNIQVNSNDNDNMISCLKDEALEHFKVYTNLFGITCLPHLVDKCLDPTICQFSHQFNDPGVVFQRLQTLNVQIINQCYQFSYNHKKLFCYYFNVFCTYYTIQKDRNKLLYMVNDCERYPECALFISDIYEGLVKCGFSRANACRQILKRNRDTSSHILDALVAIILKSDWTMFSDYIEKYTKEEYKYNFRINVLEQMAPAVLKSKEPNLKQVFGKCVQMLHCEDTGLLLNSPILIQCVALLTQT